jgi:hypothetical protein
MTFLWSRRYAALEAHLLMLEASELLPMLGQRALGQAAGEHLAHALAAQRTPMILSSMRTNASPIRTPTKTATLGSPRICFLVRRKPRDVPSRVALLGGEFHTSPSHMPANSLSRGGRGRVRKVGDEGTSPVDRQVSEFLRYFGGSW